MEIIKLIQKDKWNHVSSEDNPADLASRGILLSEVGDNPMWWYGPTWLTKQKSCWPTSVREIKTDLELRKTVCSTSIVAVKNEFMEIMRRYSTISKLKRVTAYCFRFINNLKNTSNRRKGVLTVAELYIRVADVKTTNGIYYADQSQRYADFQFPMKQKRIHYIIQRV